MGLKCSRPKGKVKAFLLILLATALMLLLHILYLPRPRYYIPEFITRKTNPDGSHKCKIPVAIVAAVTKPLGKGILKLIDLKLERQIPVILASYGYTSDQLKNIIGQFNEVSVEVVYGQPTNFSSTHNESNIYVIIKQHVHYVSKNVSSSPTASIDVKYLAYLAAWKMSVCSVFEIDANSNIIDNMFFTTEYIEKLSLHEPLTLHSYNQTTMNPYGVFSMYVSGGDATCIKPTYSKIHPRGTPHPDTISAVIPTIYTQPFHSNSTKPKILHGNYRTGIVQTLLSTWPDLNSKEPFACGHTLLVTPRIRKASLNPFQYAAVNNKATLFYEDMLWSMFTPPSLPDSIADIWRGYIAQTLMRCSEYVVVFHQPVAEALPAPKHTDMSSLDTQKFLLLLDGFQCNFNKQSTNGSLVPVCFKQLYKYLFENHILSSSDLHLLTVWLDELKASNYQFPQLKINLCIRSNKHSYKHPHIHTSPFPPPNPTSFGKLNAYNSALTPGDRNLSDVLLLVTINFNHVEVIPLWLAMYQYLAPPTVVFYAPGTWPCHSILTDNLICNVSQDAKGYLMYESAADAMDRFPGYSLYVSLHDDMAFNPLMFRKLLESGESAMMTRTEMIGFCISKNGRFIKHEGPPWVFFSGLLTKQVNKMLTEDALIPLITKYSKYCPREDKDYAQLKNSNEAPCIQGTGYIGDGFAVAAKDVKVYLEVTKVMLKYELFLEVALPWLMRCALGAGLKPGNTLYWSHTRYNDETLDLKAWNEHAVNLRKLFMCYKMRKSAQSLLSEPLNTSIHPSTALVIAHPVKLLAKEAYLNQALLLRQCFTNEFLV